MDEASLVDAARRDPDAFAHLYERTVDGVYRLALSLTADHSSAEDETSEAFRRALANLSSYEDRGRPFSAWLFTIARNVVRDGARRYGREIPLPDREIAADDSPGDEMARAEETCLVRVLVRRLSPVQQRVVVLHYGHSWSYQHVGERMGKSEAAVKQIAYRALQNLRCWAREAE